MNTYQPRHERAGRRLFHPDLLNELYAARAYAPLWTEHGPLAARLSELPAAIDAGTAHGLAADQYHRDALLALLESPAPAPVDLELLASDAFLQQVRHRSTGAVSPRDLDPEWGIAEPEVDPLQTLRAAATSGQHLGRLLDALWPANAEYHALVRQRARLRARDAEANGSAGPATGAAPDTASLIDRIDANLERWRWLPRHPPDTYVRVNIAAFALQVIRGGDEHLAMDVIVGLPYRRTPVFAAPITQIVVNPYWNVPHRLAVQDKLPILKRDPGALAAQIPTPSTSTTPRAGSCSAARNAPSAPAAFAWRGRWTWLAGCSSTKAAPPTRHDCAPWSTPAPP